MNRIFIFLISTFLCYAGLSQTRGAFLKETFDGSTMPAGWTIDIYASNWSISNSNNAGGEPRELRLNWNNSQWTGKTRVISPVINTTGATELLIDFLHCFNRYSGSHTIGIETTSDGGATWNAGWQQVYSSSGTWHITQVLSTPDVGSANFQFCLFYNGYVYNVDDWYFDNFELFSQENLDVALTAIDNPTYSATHKADFTLFNKGKTAINSLEVEYQFDALPPVVETFSSLNIATLTSKALSFETETLLEPGSHVLKVNILKVNGVVDDDPDNNSLQKTVNVGVAAGNRRVCIEHFTSSTCPPCVGVNNQMKNLLQNNPDKFGITKYQMSWPGVGDPYYTAEGGVRRTYYGVNAVPEICYNGKDLAQAVNQNVFNTALNEPAVIDIAGSFNVTGSTVTVNFDISSYLSIPSARVYVTVNEKRTTGNALPPPNGNGETEFFHVMMKMLPDAQGTTTSFNVGEVKSFTFTQDMSGTHVEEMSDLEVHVFVQEYSSKYLFNSNFLAEYTDTQLYPPANLALQDNGDQTVTVTWDAPATGTPTGYNVYLNNELIQANHNATTYTATITKQGYQAFKVNAVYAEGVSVPIADYIMIYGGDCEPPTDLAAAQEGADVVLTWTAPDDAPNYYKVYLDGTLNQNNITETTFTLAQVPVGEHVFGVTSVTDDCESSMITVTLEVIDDDDTCDPPTELAAVQENADVILTWEAPADEVDSYNVYLDGELQINTTETTYTFVDVSEGTYLYGITAIVGECESDIVEIEFTVTGVGISEQEATFSIFPNPADDYLQITGNYIHEIALYNIVGQMIENVTVNDNHCRIATDTLNSGIYFIKIYSTDNQVYTRKIVIK